MNRNLVLLFFIIISCENYFTPKNLDPIARLDQEFLFEEDIQGLINNNSGLSDSILIVNKLINDWAINKILRSGARLNLSESKLSEISSMTYDYETELLSNSYLEALVNSALNLETDSIELDNLYRKNYEIFKLNEDLIQYVYIYISNTNPDISTVRSKLRRYKEQDRILLDSISYQFISSSFDNSTWYRRNELFKTIPILNNYEYNSFKKYKFFQFKDSLGLYLIKITGLLTKSQYAPIEHVSPTLEYMIVNKRKVELVNKIKKEILDNAIKTNKLEIYNDE